MIPRMIHFCSITIICFFALNLTEIKAQDRKLVWSDEFNGSTLDRSVWSFDLGPLNDCVQYSTDRPANTKLVDGKLQLIALEESYQGYNYTASVIKTKHAVNWRYGRIEASIKLPSSNGFVPAFWMLPEDELYGWWASSGEIDIMEHPTNEINKIYGTVHTGAYNSFTGSGPRGSVIQIPDAQTAFHLYAIEWTPDKIDFYVDDNKYYTFKNEHSGFETWPFDQPFYIILNMAVGCGWTGPPTESTVLPAIMEVDYVRVYQSFEDIAIYGPDYVQPGSKSLAYSAPSIEGAQYNWSVPNTAHIKSGQSTPEILVDWGSFSGNIELLLTSTDGSRLIKYPVEMSNNLLKNADFEKGAKYWRKAGTFPAEADFVISTQDVHSGDRALFVNVKSPGVNAWDAQLSQTDLSLKAGQSYHASFWAKSETNSGITAAIINSTNFNLYGSKSIQLTNSWAQYEFDFKAPTNATGAFNIDMGGHTGKYHFDSFQLMVPQDDNNNQVKNADFSAGETNWIFNTFAPAQANASIENGEFAVFITNGGVNPWDIHVGQQGVTVENGKQYTVSFDAHAAAPREIALIVGKNAAPWTVYNGGEQISLTTRRQTFTSTFTMNDPTDTQARIGFDIGASVEDVFFDNVFLSMGSWPAAVTQQPTQRAESFKLFPNTPNPFNPVTTIKFELPRETFVTLEIYDINGKLVETLLEAPTRAGIHSVQWDGGHYASGIYFYKLTTDYFSQINRMALIK